MSSYGKLTESYMYVVIELVGFHGNNQLFIYLFHYQN